MIRATRLRDLEARRDPSAHRFCSLFNKSSSSSSTTNLTEQENVGAGDSSLVANEGASISILDAGSIEQAFKFSSETLGRSVSLAEDSLGFANSTLGLLDKTGQVTKSFTDTLKQTLTASADEKSGTTRTALYLGGAIALVALYLWFKR